MDEEFSHGTMISRRRKVQPLAPLLTMENPLPSIASIMSGETHLAVAASGTVQEEQYPPQLVYRGTGAGAGTVARDHLLRPLSPSSGVSDELVFKTLLSCGFYHQEEPSETGTVTSRRGRKRSLASRSPHRDGGVSREATPAERRQEKEPPVRGSGPGDRYSQDGTAVTVATARNLKGKLVMDLDKQSRRRERSRLSSQRSREKEREKIEMMGRKIKELEQRCQSLEMSTTLQLCQHPSGRAHFLRAVENVFRAVCLAQSRAVKGYFDPKCVTTTEGMKDVYGIERIMEDCEDQRRQFAAMDRQVIQSKTILTESGAVVTVEWTFHGIVRCALKSHRDYAKKIAKCSVEEIDTEDGDETASESEEGADESDSEPCDTVSGDPNRRKRVKTTQQPEDEGDDEAVTLIRCRGCSYFVFSPGALLIFVHHRVRDVPEFSILKSQLLSRSARQLVGDGNQIEDVERQNSLMAALVRSLPPSPAFP